MVPVLALLALLAPPAAAAEPAFARHPEHCAAALLVDIPMPPGIDLPELGAAVLNLGLPAILLVRPPQVEGMAAEISLLWQAGAELGLWVQWPEADLAPSPADAWGQLRRERRELRRELGAPPRAAGSTALPTAVEGSLDIFGFTLLLPAPDGLVQAPRRTLDLQGLDGAGVVLWPVQPSHLDERVGAPQALAATLDAAALALEQGRHPVVRLSLPATLVLAHGELLSRWRDEVLAPCGAVVVGRSEAEAAIKAWVRTDHRGATTTGAAPVESPPQREPIEASTLPAAAQPLTCAPTGGLTLPRAGSGGLDLSQAWLAFALTLAGRPTPLALYAVRPPQSSPRSVLPDGGVVLEREVLRRAVVPLIPGPGEQIPAFVRVGADALTAAELLCAMASAIAGDDPILVTRTYSPDPFSPGLGWGGY